MTEDAAEVCGETFDHGLALIDERDGAATYECQVCGAEVLVDPEDDPDCE